MTALLFEKRGQQAWLTLNRPDHKNLMNGEMFVQLVDAWAEVRTDDGIRVAIVTAYLGGGAMGRYIEGGEQGELEPIDDDLNCHRIRGIQ